MADVFNKKKRSEIMSRIRAKETGIERAVFSHLRKKRVYFQKHYDRVPGKPDIAVPSKKLAVFIDGDFWHGYRFESWKRRIPKEYWRSKIESNIARDCKNYRALRRAGWKVLKIWGHTVIKQPEKTCLKISSFLKSTSSCP
jgi:DNA mismatch endonuclease (patch repair protein)